MLFDHAEQTAIIGGAHNNFAIGQQLGCIRTSRPPDNAVFDGVEFGQRLILTFGRAQNVINRVFGYAVTQQGPFHVVDRALFKAAFARIGFQIEHSTDIAGCGIANHIGTIAECGRIHDLWNEAIRHQKITKVIRGRCAIGGRCQLRVSVNFQCQAFVTQTDGISSNHVNHIPGDVASFVHGAQFGHGFSRAVIVDNGDTGLFGIGVVVSQFL